jgi:hypothetical protein
MVLQKSLADNLGHGDDQMHNIGPKESPTKVGKSLYQIKFQMIINSAKGQKRPLYFDGKFTPSQT